MTHKIMTVKINWGFIEHWSVPQVNKNNRIITAVTLSPNRHKNSGFLDLLHQTSARELFQEIRPSTCFINFEMFEVAQSVPVFRYGMLISYELDSHAKVYTYSGREGLCLISSHTSFVSPPIEKRVKCHSSFSTASPKWTASVTRKCSINRNCTC